MCEGSMLTTIAEVAGTIPRHWLTRSPPRNSATGPLPFAAPVTGEHLLSISPATTWWQVASPAVPGGMDHPDPASHGDREITDLLLQLRDNHPEAMDRLFPLIYDQLR